jgi:hypothetical protein
MRTLCLALFVLVFGSSVALADKGYKKVPTEQASHGAAAPATAPSPAASSSGLDLKVVSYDGAVNGELTVEVKNTTKIARTFTATGLYFVPEGNADEAPQRLGAVGPMQIAGAPNGATNDAQRVEKLVIQPGAAVQVKLDVFCIDSHRPSPTSKNQFSLGSKRLPAKLRSTIETRSKAAVDEVGGYAAPAAKSAVQSQVWEARDADWVKIDGEGKQEARKQNGGPAPRQQMRQQMRQPMRQPVLEENLERDEAPQVQEQRKQ